MLTILSWNILQGGGSRLIPIINEIGKVKPSICVFSEFHNNESGSQLRYQLLRLGYRHQFVTQASKDENSVLIVSSLPCTSEVHPSSDPEYSNNILSVHFDAFSILGVYLPHKKKHVLFDFIINQIIVRDRPYIITGDFNSGINKIDQAGTSFWYEEKLMAMSKLGYKDAFRHVYGDVQEFSWYSHQGNGYRYDHTYVHDDLLPIIKDCKYMHSWREQKLSDHSPMWIDIG